jgi:hypothetical protein
MILLNGPENAENIPEDVAGTLRSLLPVPAFLKQLLG